MAARAFGHHWHSYDIAVRVLTPTAGDDGEALPPTVRDDDLWREQWRGHGIKYPASRREREREKALAAGGKQLRSATKVKR